MIMIDFFEIAFRTFDRNLPFFYTKDRKLNKIYKWETEIMSLDIDHYTKITRRNHRNVETEILLQDLID